MPAFLTRPLHALCLSLLAGCAPSAVPPPVVPAVFVTAVRNDSGSAERVLFGSLRPRVESELAFRTGGKVSARLVELGQSVRAGQALARLDPADLRLGLQAGTDQQRAAEVDAVQAAGDAARWQRLLADGMVARSDAERQQARADAAAARLAQAQRQAELARNRAGYAVLTAPFDAVVTALRFEAGQMVGEGQAVLGLARPGEWELQADVPEALAAGLHGWVARTRLGRADVPLRLRELAPGAAAATRTVRARYSITDLPPGIDLRIGMAAELRLRQEDTQPSAELPLGALLATGAPAGAPNTPSINVWLADAATGALTRQPVHLLSQTSDSVRVAGLPDGALVVSVGAQKLDAGMRVRPVLRPLEPHASPLASARP